MFYGILSIGKDVRFSSTKILTRVIAITNRPNTNSVIRPNFHTISSLLSAVFASISTSNAQLAVGSSWVTGDTVNKSVVANFVNDLPIIPTGQTTNPGWALGRLNKASDLSPATSYLYPETKTPVRLYLIDNSVDNSSGWFNGNSNLSIETNLVGNPVVPGTPRDTKHGSEMLGIIAGPGTGSAQGTPIEVINYDIYPNGPNSASSSGLLSEAIVSALIHHEEDPKPSIICIAAGSSFPGTSFILQYDISSAVAQGITVIVAAGNSSLDASGFVPAAYGETDGVICVGASNQLNGRLGMSNYGSSVDFYAPGESVKTINVSAPSNSNFGYSTGSSPATAMATGAALATLSMNPALAPAELEAKLKGSVFTSSVDIVQLPPIDSDGDGSHDVLEKFSGNDPLLATDTPEKPALGGSGLANGNTSVSISFTINASLFNGGNPSELSDGVTWKVKESFDTKNWQDSTSGSFTFGSASNGKIPVTYTRVGGETACFLKLEITPAP